MKRTLKISIILIVLILVGIVIYFLVRPKTNENIEDVTTPTEYQQPPLQPNNTQVIVTTPVTEGGVTFNRTHSKNVLRQITNYPVSGYVAQTVGRVVEDTLTNPETQEVTLIKRTLPVETITFVKKETGEIFEAEVTESIIDQRKKTSNKVPKTEDAVFWNKASDILFRFLNTNGRTIESIFGVLPQSSTPFPVCDNASITRDLKKGDRGDTVQMMQQILREDLVLDDTFVADGIFGAGTESRVREFQKKHTLDATGIVDERTRAAIATLCATWSQENARRKNESVDMTSNFGPTGIENVTISPDKMSLFYTRKEGGVLKGFTIRRASDIPKQVFTSPFTEWMPQWVSTSLIGLTTFASRESVGYLYGLNPDTGTSIKLFGPVTGLTTNIHTKGIWMLYSESTQDGFAAAIINLKTRKQHALELSTLPEKCTWSLTFESAYCAIPKRIPKNVYPDNWYRDLVTFDDEFWKIDTDPFVMKLLYTPEEAHDFIRPVLSPTEDFLYVTDKNTGYLWVLSL